MNQLLAKYPNEIRDILATSRPFFGKGGLLSLKGPTKTQYGGMLTIQEYPALTCPGILNDLLGMPFELVVSQSFTFLSKPVAVGRMKRQQARMVNAGDVAVSQVEDIDDALDDLTSNRFVMGTHHLSVFVRADDQKALNEHISDAGAALSEAGMKWAREDSGIAGAFYAQLPGNFDYRVRAGDITSRNFAGFSSFHNYPIGRIRGNQWGDAVMMFKTTSGAPYYFNFHKGEQGADAKKAAKLDPNHKDLANTVVIGKSGTGKTVLEMALLAQTQKFSQPDKGKVLNQMALFWFERLAGVVPNHLTGVEPESVVAPDEREQVRGRSMVVKRLKPILVEAVVRGYLIGSGWKDYVASGAVCGIALPPGLQMADRLPEPIFTPAAKAELGEHDENIDFDEMAARIGAPLAERIRAISLELYRRASEYAATRGIIIADTKFEFGLDAQGTLHLMDEVLTADSSRFWPADEWRPGISPPSFDKQFVRDYLETVPGWNKRPPPPPLPREVIEQTAAKYREALRRLTGQELAG